MSDISLYAKSLTEHYAPLIKQDANSFRAVDWGSKESQFKRFAVLCEAGETREASILDVGCGVGHFVDYLTEAGHRGTYRGIDAVPDMIEAARGRHPGHQFELTVPQGARTDLRADYVFGSGIFAFADWDITRATISEMYALADRACGFNVLSSWAPDRFPGEYQYEPADVLAFCRTLTPWVVLRHDYLVHDATFYMYRREAR